MLTLQFNSVAVPVPQLPQAVGYPAKVQGINRMLTLQFNSVAVLINWQGGNNHEANNHSWFEIKT
jgi:hypothetical protein